MYRLFIQKLILLAALLPLLLAGCVEKPESKTATAITTTTAEINSLGTDFYLTLPDHICSSDPASCRNGTVSNRLLVTAATNTSGEVTFNNITTAFTVTAGSSTTIALDASVVLTSNETIESKAIHVTSLQPVSVHVISENSTSADGYLALPTPALGTHYIVMSYASSRYSGSEFAIVATEDSSTITITPTAPGSSKPAGTAYSVILNKGQTYQLQNTGTADMTGSLVTGDKPFALFAGHRCSDVPSGTGYCDYLVEQLPDTSAWGTTFHSIPFKNRARYQLRVLASTDGTTITTQPAGLINTTLNAGQYADITLTGSAEIVASNPVLVAQYMRGYDDDTAAMGDPAMTLLNPAELGMTDTTFAVHGLTGSPGAYMNVISETVSISTLQLDGTPVNAADFTQIGTGTYSSAMIPVSAGAHHLKGSSPYSAIVYDYGISWNAVSYAYPAGTKISLATTTVANPAATCADPDSNHSHYHGHHHHHHGYHHGHRRHRHDDKHDDCHP